MKGAGLLFQRHTGLIRFGAWVLVLVLLLSLPGAGLSPIHIREMVLIGILALTVSGLNLAFGYAGELNLGQAAIYAGGAYITGYLAKNVLNDILFTLFAAVLVGLLIGVLSGAPGLRMGGWMLAIMSFFLVLLIAPIINIFGSHLGGFSGLTGIPRAQLLGNELDDNGLYMVAMVVVVAWFAFFRNLVTSRHGAALLVLKESPVLAASLGISAYSMKLKAYAFSAVPAALAGCLFAYLDGFIAPESFGLNLSVTILAASILGGAISVSGAIVGAAVLVLGPAENPWFEEWSLVVYGVFLVLGGVLFNDGIAGLATRLAGRVRPAPQRVASDSAREEIHLGDLGGRPLVLDNVSKSFGGVTAVAGVSLTAAPGQVTALIGPNGSGKTTILNLISGFYRADGGSVKYGDRELVGLRVHEVSRAGVGRTFQTPIVPAKLSVRDVVAAANFDRTRSSFIESGLRLPRFHSSRRSDAEIDHLLSAVGLADVADAPASSLALGTRRMVELARTLAGKNGLILLDEVAAGLDEVELGELAKVVATLRDAGATVVLVEHNFAFVQAVADRVVVLSEGGVIAEGTSEEIRNDENVLKSYLGEGSAVTGTRIHGASPDGM